MTRLKLWLAATAVLMTLAALTSTAGAYTATLSRGGSITTASLGKITFGISPTVACNLTLSGTLATRLELAEGAHLGEISGARIASCTSGAFERFLGLPWEMTVGRVGGTLPDSATTIEYTLHDAAFNFSILFESVSCLYEGDSGGVLSLTDTGTNTYSSALIRSRETLLLELIEGGGPFCPAELGLRGVYGLAPQQTITVS